MRSTISFLLGECGGDFRGVVWFEERCAVTLLHREEKSEVCSSMNLWDYCMEKEKVSCAVVRAKGSTAWGDKEAS